MKTNILKIKLYFLIILLPNIFGYSQQFVSEKELAQVNGTTYEKTHKEYTLNQEQRDTISSIKNLLLLSKISRINLNYGNSFKHTGEALFLSEQIKDTLQMAYAHKEYGILNYLFKQDKLAGVNFNKARQYFKKSTTDKNELYQSFYNLILYNLRIKNKPMVQSYIDSCEAFVKNDKLDLIKVAYLNEKKANLYKWDNKINKAITVLNESFTILNNNEHHKTFLIILNGFLADLHLRKGNKELAKQHYQNSSTIPDKFGEHTFYQAYVHTKYANLLYHNKQYKEAYLNIFKAKKINDTYLNPRNEDTQNLLTLKDLYKEKLQLYSQKIDSQQLELSIVKQKILRFKNILIASICLIIFIGLLVWTKLKSKKHQKQQEKSEKKIATSNAELTKNVLQLIEKEEIIGMLKEHIRKNQNDSSSKSLLKSIDKQSKNLWDLFNNSFVSYNKGFYDRLQKQVPNLSSSDLKICALIKLNFSSKEMSYLLGISLGSVHVARHRLRKKINLERDVNLTNFISSI